MARFKRDRAFYIPAGKPGMVTVRAKGSDAVAYLWEAAGRPVAKVFVGKAAKPVLFASYVGLQAAARREADVKRLFANAAARVAAKEAERAAAKAWVCPYKVGDLFRCVWGYDQTNVDWYQVVAVKGKMLDVRRIETAREETGFMSGKAVPLPGQFLARAEVRRFRAYDGGFRVASYARAYYVAPKMIAGVPVYDANFYSEYA